MATRSSASAVVSLPVDQVWSSLRDFSFPRTLIKTITNLVIEDGSAFSIGSIRKVEWNDGQWLRQRLIELDDVEMRVAWELIESHPVAEIEAQTSILTCHRITEDNSTLIRWEVIFSAGATSDLIRFHQRAIQQNLTDIRESLTGCAIPTLCHVVEGPSSRVIWAASELALPMRVRVNDIELGSGHAGRDVSLVNSAEANLFHPTANVMPTFFDDGMELIESGNILLYLIDRYDTHNLLHPARESSTPKQRAQFRLWFFFTSATCDPLLLEAYLHMFVLSPPAANEEIIATNREKWNQAVEQRFEPSLREHEFIAGARFSMADIMVGHTVYFASMLGWVNDDSVIGRYLKRLKQRPGFQQAYQIDE